MFAVWLLAGCSLFSAGNSLPPSADTYYEQLSRRIVTTETSPAVGLDLTAEPREVIPPEDAETRELTLAEAIRLAMHDNVIVHDSGQFLSSSNPLLSSPDHVASVFDVAIQESGGAWGGGGIEAARAAFDPYFSGGASYGANSLIQNYRFLSGGLTPGDVLQENSGLLTSRIEKRLQTGGTLTLRHDWSFLSNNVPNRLLDSSYTGILRAEVRQPLLAAAGTKFTQVAGPPGSGTALPVNQGIVIAKLNRDISAAEFETRIQTLVRQVQEEYWTLSLAYSVYDSESLARDRMQEIWQRLQSRFSSGLSGAGAAEEALARKRFYEQEAATRSALADLYEADARLRRMLGLPPDGRELLKPVDEPVTAVYEAEWLPDLSDALSRRVELRRQQENIRSLTLQLEAARSLKLPRVDVIAGTQLNGFGNHPFTGSANAYGTLLSGEQTGWDVGLEVQMPFGQRQARAQVRNLELRLSKARAVLAAQEVEIRHELAHTHRELGRWKERMALLRSGKRAASDYLTAVTAEYDSGRARLDDRLSAEIDRARAEAEWYRSVIRYNLSLVRLHFRKGTLLEASQIQLAEGAWDAESYAATVREAASREDVVAEPAVPHGSTRLIQPTEPADSSRDAVAEELLLLPDLSPADSTSDTLPERMPALRGAPYDEPE